MEKQRTAVGERFGLAVVVRVDLHLADLAVDAGMVHEADVEAMEDNLVVAEGLAMVVLEVDVLADVTVRLAVTIAEAAEQEVWVVGGDGGDSHAEDDGELAEADHVDYCVCFDL